MQHLEEQAKTMEEAVAKIHEVGTWLIVHQDEYSMSGNSSMHQGQYRQDLVIHVQIEQIKSRIIITNLNHLSAVRKTLYKDMFCKEAMAGSRRKEKTEMYPKIVFHQDNLRQDCWDHLCQRNGDHLHEDSGDHSHQEHIFHPGHVRQFHQVHRRQVHHRIEEEE
jgi:hypothetical protein